jgi:hypothetical protein
VEAVTAAMAMAETAQALREFRKIRTSKKHATIYALYHPVDLFARKGDNGLY